MRRLSRLYSRFHAETEQLAELFLSPLPNTGPCVSTCPAAHLQCREMCVVRLHDGWTRFCRELVISSASEEPVSVSGVRLPRAAGVTSRQDVLPLLTSLYRRQQWWEPNWGIPADCIDAAARLGIANISRVRNALGAIPSPVEPLRHSRNFAAHRKLDTRRKFVHAVALAGFAPTASIDTLVSQTVGPGLTLYELWIAELRAIAQAAVE